ncbi:MAG: hypothetical protein QM809_10475 [Gordonia sp. (in: high G+C Gram-positive bacteria)]|uniref:hypothetical protein n=1 Tax=Gordonia sp. (in: high G+C Gram-positive bacteria) TaxID=84139 RepID=UPI0039E2D421
MNSDRGAGTLLGLGLLLWLVAMVHSYARTSLWVLDLAVVSLMWLCAVAGLVCLVVGAVRLGRRSRGRTAAAAALIAVVLLITTVVGAWWPLSPRTWFATHRALYRQALSTDPGHDYYGAPLPAHLRFLSAGGRVSGDRDSARFFPQWIGVPDDAGGYWHSPAGSPAGYDMYGLRCRDPIALGDDWWMCGLADR